MLRNVFAAGTSRAVRSMWLVVISTLVMPIALLAGGAWLSYRDLKDQSDAQAARTLDLLHEHAVNLFETQRLIAASIDDALDGLSSDEIRSRSRSLHERLRRLVEPLDQIDDIWVLDENGRPLLTARTHPLPANLDYSDRAYFQLHRDRNAPSLVSELLVGRLRNIEFFQFSVRRNSPTGSFAGVVAISVPVDYFVKLYSNLSGAKGYTASLVRADGSILARFPAPPEGGRRLDPQSPFMQAIGAVPERGRYYSSRSGVDGVERDFFYRKLDQYPVYVSFGAARESVRDAWLGRMATHLVFGLPATLALFLLSLVAYRRTLRETDALRRLQVEIDRRTFAEEGLRQAQKMEAIGHLTAGLAHDFNNLLTGIGGAVDLIGRRLSGLSPDVPRLVGVARAGVERAATLTQRLLAFSRQQPLQLEPVDANRLVSAMSELLHRTLGERVKVETVLAGGLWLARADAMQLESAILNLAINARDAMPDGGTLTIETANAHLDDAYASRHAEVAAGQYVMVAVTDSGIGMDSATIARATDPFFTTKQRGQGTGLGLSMVFGYAKQIGGHLKIYSEVGKGTVVKLYLPRQVGASVPEPANVFGDIASGGRPGHAVLVVEDDPIVRDFSVSALRELGYSVEAAVDGPSALQMLETRPDTALLFTDIGLPGNMNGRQLATAATERYPSLRVLFTTGYTANAIVHDGALDPGVDFISKPFSIDALGNKIRAMGF